LKNIYFDVIKYKCWIALLFWQRMKFYFIDIQYVLVLHIQQFVFCFKRLRTAPSFQNITLHLPIQTFTRNQMIFNNIDITMIFITNTTTIISIINLIYFSILHTTFSNFSTFIILRSFSSIFTKDASISLLYCMVHWSGEPRSRATGRLLQVDLTLDIDMTISPEFFEGNPRPPLSGWSLNSKHAKSATRRSDGLNTLSAFIFIWTLSPSLWRPSPIRATVKTHGPRSDSHTKTWTSKIEVN